MNTKDLLGYAAVGLVCYMVGFYECREKCREALMKVYIEQMREESDKTKRGS